MLAAADAMEFERAAKIRDRIEKMRMAVGEEISSVDWKSHAEEGGKRKKGRARTPRPKRNV